MIEHIRILTGTPAEVEAKLADALAEHPNTTVLSSCITVLPAPVFATSEPNAEPADKKPKDKAKPKNKEPEAPADASAEESPSPKTAEPPAPREHLCVIIGRKF